MLLNRNKTLPELPLGCRASACEVHATPSLAGTTSSNTKALPAVRVEETLSTKEMDNLRDCWNRSSGTVGSTLQSLFFRLNIPLLERAPQETARTAHKVPPTTSNHVTRCHRKYSSQRPFRAYPGSTRVSVLEAVGHVKEQVRDNLLPSTTVADQLVQQEHAYQPFGPEGATILPIQITIQSAEKAEECRFHT